MKKEKIYSLKEMKELKCSRSRCYEHENGNYSYKKGFEKWHLIINGKDVLKGLKALELHYYNVNDYAYITVKPSGREYGGNDFYLNLVINGSISEIHFPYESDIKYHGNGSYSYLDSDEYFHLVIDGVDVLEGLEAFELDYYGNKIYSYENCKNGYRHLIINGVDILKDKEAKWCNYFEDGTYYYCGNDGVRMIINGKNVLEGLKVSFCSYHGNGVYSYEDKKEYKHLIVNGKDVLEGKEAVILWKYENGVCHYTNKDKNDLFLEIK